MTSLSGSIRADRFLPLPRPLTRDGAPRRTGIEIEFGGLSETEVAGVVRDCLGGRIDDRKPNEITLQDTEIGRIEILLDTAFRRNDPGPVRAALLEAARPVVPIEVVTAPLPFDALPLADRLRGALRDAGATGTRHGALLGFGVHLNPEVPALDAAAIGPVLRAFALLEDWLREDDPIDTTRRILPFVDRYPRDFTDLLANGTGLDDLDTLIDVYLDRAPSRNHGLDLLPLIRHIAPDRLVAALGAGAGAVSARPTWHYRLPDCRIDEPGWSLALEWNRWRVVECVAASPALLARLSGDWLDRDDDSAGAWAAHVAALLEAAPDPAAS